DPAPPAPAARPTSPAAFHPRVIPSRTRPRRSSTSGRAAVCRTGSLTSTSPAWQPDLHYASMSRSAHSEGRAEEADHVGFPGPGGGGQALGVPGVRHHPHLHGGGRGGLEPAGRDRLVGDGPAG